jgi:glycosyltransferase involved in cell wall biosynthesis
VRLLLITPALYQEISAQCRAYVAAYHDQEKIISAYEKTLSALAYSESTEKELVENAA